MAGDNNKNRETPHSQLREIAEEQLVRWFKDISSGENSNNLEEVLYELKVHQIELEIQHEELQRAHIELEESRDRYRDLYDFAPAGYISLTEKGLISEANLTAANILGIERRKLINKRFRAFIAPHDQDMWIGFFKDILKGITGKFCELVLLQQDGKEFPARIEGICVQMNGSPHVRISISNNAERKRAIDLEASNLYHRELIEASIDPFVTISPHGHITDVNRATEEVTGYSRTELIGTNFSNYFTEPNKAQSGYLTVFQTGKVCDYPLDICHKNGNITPVLYNASVYHNKKGDIQGVFAIARDITERKCIEKAFWDANNKVQAANRYHRCLIEASIDPFVTISPEGKITDVNQATEQATGLMRDELIGTDFSMYFTEPEKAQTGYLTVFKNGRVQDYPLEMRHKNGSTIPVLYNASIYYSTDATILGIFAIARDISEMKKVEQSLQESNKKIRLLISLTRHDILNHLTVLQGLLGLATEQKDIIPVINYINRSYEICHRIEATIGFTAEYEEFGLGPSRWGAIYPIIESAKGEVNLRGVIIKNQILFNLEIYADPIIKKVFTTLIENAVRHGGKVTNILFDAYEDGEKLVIVCEDDGFGISQSQKEYIFDHGYGKHTGIGLFLSREILSITDLSIRECGGKGMGARFEILVPAGKFRRNGHSNA